MILSSSEVERYQTDGFVVVDRPVLSEAEVLEARASVESLLRRWTELPKGRANGRPMGSESHPDLAEIRGATIVEPTMGQLSIIDHCRELASELLGSRRVWFHFDHVFSKQPSEDTRVLWHQDRASSVTRMIRNAVHIWIPLQDVTEETGCVSYLPGSHRQGLKAHDRYVRPNGTSQFTTLVDDSEAVACPVRLGGFVAHDPMTIHASGVNHSEHPRHAWVLQFGTGPWVALRQASRPAMMAAARLQTVRLPRQAGEEE
jgi:ectoine hydroxylase-related dioxygenase (phytanoyl-CoA dioxygenase family)